MTSAPNQRAKGVEMANGESTEERVQNLEKAQEVQAATMAGAEATQAAAQAGMMATWAAGSAGFIAGPADRSPHRARLTGR